MSLTHTSSLVHFTCTLLHFTYKITYVIIFMLDQTQLYSNRDSSPCPVLESLCIERSLCDDTKVLRVFSRYLLSFSYAADSLEFAEDRVLAIHARIVSEPQ